jgi:hypothetical protein
LAEASKDAYRARMGNRRHFAAGSTVLMVGILCVASPSDGSTRVAARGNQASELPSNAALEPRALTGNSSAGHTTPQATAAECRKAAQHNQQYCRKLKGKAMVACYVAVGAMLAACLATAKG